MPSYTFRLFVILQLVLVLFSQAQTTTMLAKAQKLIAPAITGSSPLDEATTGQSSHAKTKTGKFSVYRTVSLIR
jgi:hypothetical protein